MKPRTAPRGAGSPTCSHELPVAPRALPAPAAPAPGALLDCGHGLPARAPDSIATGYAIEPETGRRICYPCAETAERAAFQVADSFFAYLSGDGKRITTWTGAELARVVGCSTAEHVTPSGGVWTAHYIRAAGPGGSTWIGVSPGFGMYVRLRRQKRRARPGAGS